MAVFPTKFMFHMSDNELCWAMREEKEEEEEEEEEELSSSEFQ